MSELSSIRDHIQSMIDHVTHVHEESKQQIETLNELMGKVDPMLDELGRREADAEMRAHAHDEREKTLEEHKRLVDAHHERKMKELKDREADLAEKQRAHEAREHAHAEKEKAHAEKEKHHAHEKKVPRHDKDE